MQTAQHMTWHHENQSLGKWCNSLDEGEEESSMEECGLAEAR